MKRYLLKLLAFVSLQCVLAVLLWQDAPQEPRSDHYLAALIDKHEALLHQPGPRLLIVGGSSAAFGLCSPIFQQKLQLTPVNLGIHGAAGLEFMLRHAERHARPGDVILLCPEPMLLAGDRMEPEPSLKTEILKVWPSGATYMPQRTTDFSVAKWKKYFDRLAVEEMQQRLRRGVFDAPKPQAPVRELPPPPSNRAFRYTRSGFNEFGDMIGHYTEKHKPFDMPRMVQLNEQRVEVAVSRINRFVENCQRKEARVFLAYAPLLEGTQPQTAELHSILGKRLQIPILHHPRECTFATEDFYDTPMHLGGEAAKKRSRFLADRLYEQLLVARVSGDSTIRR